MSKKGRKPASLYQFTIFRLHIVKGQWTEQRICEKSPFDSFHILTPESDGCAADTRPFLKAEHLNGQERDWPHVRVPCSSCLAGLKIFPSGTSLQSEHHAKSVLFWIWKQVNVLNLSWKHDLPSKDYDNKTWCGGWHLGDIAVNYNCVSNIKQALVEHVAIGCFNPISANMHIEVHSLSGLVQYRISLIQH